MRAEMAIRAELAMRAELLARPELLVRPELHAPDEPPLSTDDKGWIPQTTCGMEETNYGADHLAVTILRGEKPVGCCVANRNDRYWRLDLARLADDGNDQTRQRVPTPQLLLEEYCLGTTAATNSWNRTVMDLVRAVVVFAVTDFCGCDPAGRRTSWLVGWKGLALRDSGKALIPPGTAARGGFEDGATFLRCFGYGWRLRWRSPAVGCCWTAD